MEWYSGLKMIHMLTAALTALLFVTRVGLDAAGKPGWRTTPLRFLPHINDTILLAAAIGLVIVTPWMPFVHHWLTLKVLLLIGYIVAGLIALKPKYSRKVRVLAAAAALGQLVLIFALALHKPTF
ncbi:SirB2 family protein [Allohahella marinimesophila]|uniref:SirB2 family protein n=1 Tax=Allohahella marinimesophila TaxID=1054972 RepID=A0ABP7Q8F6_9GAMM